MKDLTRRLGVALIIITHNLGVVARYADQVNVMYAGRIVESGTARDIYHRPSHPYTLALLRSVPHAILPDQSPQLVGIAHNGLTIGQIGGRTRNPETPHSIPADLARLAL